MNIKWDNKTKAACADYIKRLFAIVIEELDIIIMAIDHSLQLHPAQRYNKVTELTNSLKEHIDCLVWSKRRLFGVDYDISENHAIKVIQEVRTTVEGIHNELKGVTDFTKTESTLQAAQKQLRALYDKCKPFVETKKRNEEKKVSENSGWFSRLLSSRILYVIITAFFSVTGYFYSAQQN